MRKLVVVFVLLIVVAGVVFYFGWIQFKIPENSYGVIFTKTHGWEADPIPAGEFVWRWQRLLPTNLTLFVYPVEPQQIRVEAKGSLPSAGVYASAIEGSVDFSYRVDADVSFRIRPSHLPEVAQQDVEPDELDDWYEGLEGPVREALISVLMDAASEAPGAPSRAGLSEAATSRLQSRFAELEFVSVSPRSMDFPDYELYARAKALYLSALEAQEAGVAEAEEQAAFTLTQQRSRIELLREYGQVLSEYPVLLDYFTMSAERGIDPLKLEDLRSGADGNQ